MLLTLRSAVFSVLMVTLIGPAATAQARKAAPSNVVPNSMRLVQLRVFGSKRFQSETLAKVVDLKLGTEITEDQMRAAADRLASTGMFTDVTYSYVSSPSGTRLEYKINDAEKFYPAHFDNFVWLPREDLLKKIRERDPLFCGEVPAAGEMYQRVAEHVKALLQERNVKADVIAMPEAPQAGGSILGFLYKVQGIKIPIRSFEFPGATPDLAALLQSAVSSQIGSDYSTSRMSALARLDLMPVYLQRGYVRARFKDAEFVLVDEDSNSVAVRIPVDQGAQYILDSVQWSGNTAYSSADLSKALKVAFGRPANQLQLEDDLGGISKIYGTKGYLRAQLKPSPNFDETSHKVSYSITVMEGDQYKMGTLTFEGVSPSQESHIRPLWKLQPGAVFDTTYMQMFVDSVASRFDLRTIRIATRQNVHEDTKTVDLVVKLQSRS